MLKNIAFIFLLSFLFSGCIKGSDASEMCNYDPCQVKAPDTEVQAVQIYVSSNSIPAVKHCSGLYYVIDADGTGKTPAVCDRITINYSGRLTNGTQFDASTAGPVTFNLDELIPGWRNGIPLIKEGGRIRLYVPPSLGYGSQDVRDRNGNVAIPGGSILIFDVELKQVQ